MIRCSNCGNENLMLTRESKLIKDARYGICSCGKVMIVQGDRAIPTPTEDNQMTKALIQDAADALNNPLSLAAVSLNKEDIATNMQPTQVKENIANYINNYIKSEDELNMDIEDNEEDYIDFDDYLDEENIFEDECCNGCNDCNCTDTSESNKKYLLITADGEKNVYKNIPTYFLEDIINDINTDFELYELKEVKLKKEVVKTVKYKL